MDDAQREEIAETLRKEMWAVKVAGLNEAEGLHLADALAPLVGGWLVGAVQAERERITRIIGATSTRRWPASEGHRISEPPPKTAAEFKADVLAVVSRDARSSSE